MGKIKLYDVENYEYPNSRIGMSFRTIQVFKCGVCGALTNKVVRMNDSSLGVQPICPNQYIHWHPKLKEKKSWRYDHPHPTSYKEEMDKEINDIIASISAKISEDIIGRPNMKKTLFFE